MSDFSPINERPLSRFFFRKKMTRFFFQKENKREISISQLTVAAHCNSSSSLHPLLKEFIKNVLGGAARPQKESIFDTKNSGQV